MTSDASPSPPPSFDSDRQRWDARYGGAGYHFGTAPNAFLAAQALRLRPGLTALCVADGEGRNSVWLAQQGLQVHAFDLSPVGVAKARALAQRAGVEVDFEVRDAASFDWSARRFDVVVAIFVQFASPALRERMFRGMVDALAPSGLLILQGYGPKQLDYATGGPGRLENLYTEELLRKSFAGLDILHLAVHDEEIDEGDAHRGMSALIDLVARNPASGAVS